jgi:hypothetical protein
VGSAPGLLGWGAGAAAGGGMRMDGACSSLRCARVLAALLQARLRVAALPQVQSDERAGCPAGPARGCA